MGGGVLTSSIVLTGILSAAMLFTDCEKEIQEQKNQQTSNNSEDYAERVIQEAEKYSAFFETINEGKYSYLKNNDNAKFQKVVKEVEYGLNSVLCNVNVTSFERENTRVKYDTINWNVNTFEDGDVSFLEKVRWINNHTQKALQFADNARGRLLAMDVQVVLPSPGITVQTIRTVVLTVAPVTQGVIAQQENTCEFTEFRNFEDAAQKVRDAIVLCNPIVTYGFAADLEIIVFGPETLQDGTGNLAWESDFYNTLFYLPHRANQPNYLFPPPEQQNRAEFLLEMFERNAPFVGSQRRKVFENYTLIINDQIRSQNENGQLVRNDYWSCSILYYRNFGPIPDPLPPLSDFP